MNNNTTTETCITNFQPDKFVQITSIIWQVSGLFSVIIGIPGHLLQIILLSNKTSRKEPTSLYLIATAICELVFLLGLFWLWCAKTSLIKIDPRQIFSCGIFYSILIGSTTLSNLYFASLSIDRSIMILSPARYRLIVTRSHVIKRIILISIIVLILIIPHHFYFTYQPKITLFICNFHLSANARRIRLWALIHAILFVSIPSLIVCISAFILLYNRCKHKRAHKNNLSPSARRMHRRSILIFFASLGIFLSLLPLCILEVFLAHDRLIHHDSGCSKRRKVYKILFNCSLTLASINYAIKFYLHLIISIPFRERFIQFIACKSNQNISRTNNGHKNEQYLLSPIVQNKAKLTEI